jgi:hypothetical protein
MSLSTCTAGAEFTPPTLVETLDYEPDHRQSTDHSDPYDFSTDPPACERPSGNNPDRPREETE